MLEARLVPQTSMFAYAMEQRLKLERQGSKEKRKKKKRSENG
jgi:hypothetical protein